MKKEKKRQLAIELPQDLADGEYANLALIIHSPVEFVFDFLRVLPNTTM